MDFNNFKKFLVDRRWIVAVLASIAIVAIFVFVGLRFWQSYKIQQGKEIATKAQQEMEKVLLQRQLKQQELAAKLRDEMLESFKQEIVSLKERPPEIRTEVRVETETIIINDTDYTDIVAEWQNRVAEVICFFGKFDVEEGTVPDVKTGSALLAETSVFGLVAMTNKHVITGEYGILSADECVVGLYGGGYRHASADSLGGSPFLSDTTGRDSALIRLDDEFLVEKEEVGGLFEAAQNARPLVCDSLKVSLGAQLIIFGYPNIGTESGITITEGIISGIENDYYVTSAKIDHGNSGGAAILVEDSCYLGIPTWVAIGEMESLGRILKMDYPFDVKK